jgi:hypothetical protein
MEAQQWAQRHTKNSSFEELNAPKTFYMHFDN